MNETLLLMLGALSTFANRCAEAVKSALKVKFPDLSPETISAAALLTSLIAGVVGALALNINLLVLLPEASVLRRVPELVGVILTGFAASVGSELIQFVTDLLSASRDRVAPPTSAPPAATTTSVDIHAETASTPTSTPEQPAPTLPPTTTISSARPSQRVFPLPPT